MLEETGIVVGVEGDLIVVETTPRSACSHCSAGSCTTSVVTRLFGARSNQLRLVNTLHVVPGQTVVISIPDQVLVWVSVLAYLVPLLSMLFAVAYASQLGLGDATQALVAVIGLLLGLGLVGMASDSQTARERYAPQLLRLAESAGIQIQSTGTRRSIL